MSFDGDHSNTNPPILRLADAYEVRRRPRPPGSSWLLDPDLDLSTLMVSDLRQRARLRALARRPADTPIVPRKAFSSKQRKEVCMMAAANPGMSHEDLARQFKTNKSTISRTLKKSDVWLKFNPLTDANVTRERYPLHLFLDFDLWEWVRNWTRDGIVITDERLKAKTLEIANEYALLDLPKPFVCSAKWLRNVKARLGVVDGKLANFNNKTSSTRDEGNSSSTSGVYNPSSESSEAARGTLPDLSSSELTPPTDVLFKNSPSPISVNSITPSLHTDSDVPLSASPSALGSTAVDSLSVWAPEALPLPAVGFASPGHGPSQSLLPQSPFELYKPDKLTAPDLAASTDQYEAYGGTCAGSVPEIELGSASLLETHMPFTLTDGSASVPQALPDMAVSFPPLVPDGLTAPIPFGSLDYGIGLPVTPDVFTDPTTPSIQDPLSDPSVPSSSAWPIGTSASPAFVDPVDISAPFIPQIDPLSTFDQQLFMSPEDIDTLAAEMRNWPAEDLLGSAGASSLQGQAVFPYDTMSSGALLPPQWPSVPFDVLGSPEFLFASTQS